LVIETSVHISSKWRVISNFRSPPVRALRWNQLISHTEAGPEGNFCCQVVEFYASLVSELLS